MKFTRDEVPMYNKTEIETSEVEAGGLSPQFSGGL
jgi:hypothetical protein